MSWELLALSTLLGVVASLTFVAGALTSSEQRQHLVANQAQRLAQRLLAWAYYAPLKAATKKDRDQMRAYRWLSGLRTAHVADTRKVTKSFTW